MGGIRKLIAGILLLGCVGCSSGDYFTRYEKYEKDLVNYRTAPEKIGFFKKKKWMKIYRLNDNSFKYMNRSSALIFIATRTGIHGTLALYEQTDTDRDGRISLLEAQAKYHEIIEVIEK